MQKKLTEGVPKFLSKDITKDQAQELWDKLSELIDDAEKILELMEYVSAQDDLINAGEAHLHTFLDLHGLVGERLISLGGLRGPLGPQELDD